MKKFKILPITIISATLLISGCAATSTMISKHSLDVQTKTSASIFLDPVPDSQKVVYVQFKNTSDKPKFSIRPEVVEALEKKGYKVTNSLNKAHYLLQATILKVGKASPSAGEKALASGYGSSLGGIAAGAAAGALVSGDSGTGALAGGLIGGVTSVIANSAVKDVTYSAITDVQISERSTTTIEERSRSELKQGISTKTTQTSHKKSHWQRYRTRIVSTAEKANLKFETALPKLKEGLTNAIAGFF